MTQLEIAQKRQLEKLEQQIFIMQSIGTRDAFHQYFFKICNEFTTRESAFNHLNDLYFQFFKKQLFTNYKAFRKYYERKNYKK